MRARTVRRLLSVLALTMGIAGLGLGVAPDVRAASSRWAPAATATIHPGVQMVSPAGQCTANFVFTDGAEVFLGLAAHCVGLGEATDVDGCATKSMPLGTPVSIEGATRIGRLAYSSWLAMDEADETDPVACALNDFALVRVDAVDHGRVNPSIPHWGGPVGINREALPALSSVYSLGNSRLRGGSPLLQPKSGVALQELGGWSHSVMLVLPGVPGDSGSALLDRQGRATGIASTLGILPVPLSNNFTDLARAYDYVRATGRTGLRLAVGTEPFNPAQLPLG